MFHTFAAFYQKNMYFKITKIWRRLTPNCIWKLDTKQTVYLTFDDGPTPEITEYILDELRKYDAVATFFCLGKNAERHPDLLKAIKDAGHQVGNHTHCHVKGWKLSTDDYIANAQKAEAILDCVKLFRPPYGRIIPAETKALNRLGYKIVMWTNISQDYNHNVSPEKCIRKVTKHLNSGDIIVFHDSVKASRNMMYALPRVLEAIKAKGLKTGLIANDL